MVNDADGDSLAAQREQPGQDGFPIVCVVFPHAGEQAG